jgi:hypothetical protein
VRPVLTSHGLIDDGQARAADDFRMVPKSSLQKRYAQNREIFRADEIRTQLFLLTRRPSKDLEVKIGVFSDKKDEEKPLYLRKEKLTDEHKTFVIVVNQPPTLAGIDPYNKLIDRISDDNMIAVTKQ